MLVKEQHILCHLLFAGTFVQYANWLVKLTHGPCTIKLFTVIIYGFS
jgi:hypothetical protein